MQNEQLKELFARNDQETTEDDVSDKILYLQFKYGEKHYCMATDLIKEIIDLPLFVPFPMEVGARLGVINLRGNIVPICDPDRYFLEILSRSKAKSSEVFARMNLRLIVFENEAGILLALPVSSVGKTEVTIEDTRSVAGFIAIEGVPHTKFNLSVIYEESK